jgi:outer membrane protein OmpA-like peptidoglycan-associated protein
LLLRFFGYARLLDAKSSDLAWMNLTKIKTRKFMHKIIISVAAVSFLACACTTDPYTGEKKVSNTALYSGGGALAGALAGQLAGGNTKATMIGTAIGAAAGAGLGYYFDNQEAKLREELKGSGVGIQRTGDKIKLIMPGSITFGTNSADINSSFYKVLNSIAKVFKEYKKTNIAVNGYTDSTGDEAKNKSLSLNRAQSVSDYLVNQGMKSDRIKTSGFGSSNPIASNNNAEGRAKNRRVEIEIIPAPSKE